YVQIQPQRAASPDSRGRRGVFRSRVYRAEGMGCDPNGPERRRLDRDRRTRPAGLPAGRPEETRLARGVIGPQTLLRLMVRFDHWMLLLIQTEVRLHITVYRQSAK